MRCERYIFHEVNQEVAIVIYNPTLYSYTLRRSRSVSQTQTSVLRIGPYSPSRASIAPQNPCKSYSKRQTPVIFHSCCTGAPFPCPHFCCSAACFACAASSARYCSFSISLQSLGMGSLPLVCLTPPLKAGLPAYSW